MSHSSQKSTVHNLQTAEDQQQTTEEDHQHLAPKKIDVPKIHELQVSISAENKRAPSKSPPPAASPRRPQDKQPLPTMVEPSESIPPQDYSPSSPASHEGAYPYPHFPRDESSLPTKIEPSKSIPPQDYSPSSPASHWAYTTSRASTAPNCVRRSPPARRPSCGCIIL